MGGAIKDGLRASDEVVFPARTLKNKDNSKMHKLYTEDDLKKLAISEVKTLENQYKNNMDKTTKFEYLGHMIRIDDDNDYMCPKLIVKIKKTYGKKEARKSELVFEEVYL
tara:strand:- start:25 stop:354 length:330 start_codon:yes stop_codon:yes gene_type:complete